MCTFSVDVLAEFVVLEEVTEGSPNLRLCGLHVAEVRLLRHNVGQAGGHTQVPGQSANLAHRVLPVVPKETVNSSTLNLCLLLLICGLYS